LIREGGRTRDSIAAEAGPRTRQVIGQATPTVLDMVSLDQVLVTIDLNALIGRIDLQHLIESIDLNALLADIDLDALLERIDLDALLATVDIAALVDSIDLDALIANTELGSLIARSTSGVASEALDVVRSQGVGLDNLVSRIVTRAMRRNAAELPEGPVLLVTEPTATPASGPSTNGRGPATNGRGPA
jgi:hypothetical protein